MVQKGVVAYYCDRIRSLIHKNPLANCFSLEEDVFEFNTTRKALNLLHYENKEYFTMEESLQLLQVAEALQSDFLLLYSQIYLGSEINADNVWNLLTKTHQLKKEVLTKACFAYLEENSFCDRIMDPKFNSIPSTILVEMANFKWKWNEQEKNENLFRAFYRWTSSKFEQR